MYCFKIHIKEIHSKNNVCALLREFSCSSEILVTQERAADVDFYQLLKRAKFIVEKMFVVKSRNSKFLYLLSTKCILLYYAKFLLFNKKRFAHYVCYRLNDVAVRLRRFATVGNDGFTLFYITGSKIHILIFRPIIANLHN